MLLSKFASVQWGYRNDKYYISKGYIHTKRGDMFTIKIEDLPLNSKVLVKVKCDCCGEEKSMHYNAYNICIKHSGKYYCRSCIYEHPKTRMKFADVQKLFKDKGYILLSKENEYKRSIQRLEYICPKHKDKGILTTTVTLLKSGSGCKYCGIESQRQKIKKYTLEDAKKIFDEHDYILLEDTFKTASTKMKCKCKNHPNIVQNKSLTSILAGKGCYYCDLIKRSERFSGEGSLTWRGGITSLRRYLRYNSSKWTKESLAYYNNKCIITGSTEDLVVHHIYSFDMILDKVIKQNNLTLYKTIGEYTDKELKTLKELFKKEHNKYRGIPLTQELHKTFHKKYGYGHNTPQQFYEFVSKYYKAHTPVQLALVI